MILTHCDTVCINIHGQWNDIFFVTKRHDIALWSIGKIDSDA